MTNESRSRSMKWIYITLVTILSVAVSEIIPYYEHSIYPLRPEYLTIPKFSPADAPKWSPGHGRSFIDLSDVHLSYKCDDSPTSPLALNTGSNPAPTAGTCKDTTFEILMFEEPPAKPWMDYWPNRQFCCTLEMVTKGDCYQEQAGKLIVPSELPGAFMRTITIPAGKKISLIDDGAVVAHHDIVKSGIYILFFSNCDPAAFPVTISGKIESVDPYGYLPADLFGNLPFYGALSCLYSIVGIIWIVYCAMHSDQLMALQLWISVVLAMGMIETTVLFAHYLHWNDYGRPNMIVSMTALIFGVMKRSFSRVVVLLVSLGYGVVRPTLGEEMPRALYLGGGYCLLSLVYTVATSFPTGNKAADDPEYDMLSFVVFVLAGVDTTFYVWILTSINNLLTSLAARKQAAKYLLYRNFRAVLLISLVATCVWVLYGSVINLNTGHGEDNNWRDHWTVDALWEMTYFLVFVAIAILWAPSKNSLRYAYSVELTQLEHDEEWKQAGLGSFDDGHASTEEAKGNARSNDDDAEYGGRLDDEGDPFMGTGAIDSHMAIAKKQ